MFASVLNTPLSVLKTFLSAMNTYLPIDKSIHSEVFYKKGVLKDFTNFTGKHQCQSFFLNKAAGLRPATLLKKDSGTGVFL